MKVLRMVALTCITVAAMAVCAGAREIPVPNIDVIGAGTAPWSPFIDKSKAGPVGSRPDGGADEFISAARYAFSVQAGIGLEDMSSGTTQLIGPGTDNDNSALAPLGFLFRYDGAFFTDFGVNGNGFLKLGGVTTGTSNVNSINSTGNAPKIMPYWDDLCIGNTGKVHYKRVPGPVGTQKLVIEWTNMKITRGNSCDGTGAGTFQVWLYDRTGVIQFVYGNGMVTAATPNGGYSIGIQSGAATNFASVTTATASVSYAVAKNDQIDAITAGTSYLFTPNMPAAPTGGSATGVTQTAATVNWTDNATDETAYLVRRTTDHVNFFFVGNTLAPNTNTFNETGLTPGTQYFYYINALSDGAFSPDLVIPVTTTAPGNISSVAAGGMWSAPSTWAGGVVPDSLDNVTIPGGATVIIDTAARAGSVTIGGPGSLAKGQDALTEGASPAVLRFGETAAFSLTVTSDVTVGANDTFSTGGGNANQHVLTVGGNLINNGTLDFSTNNNLAGAGIVFTGASNNVFGGAGPVTDILSITMNKGNSRANVLELSVSNFTVQGTTGDGPASAFLFLFNGTLKVSGTFTGNHRTFMGSAYQIVASAGFWLNNPNYTVTAQTGSIAVFGLFRISAGTWNIGTTTGNMLNVVQGSSTIIEGGSVTVTGGFTGGGNYSYNQTGGTLTTCTWGLSSAQAFCFGMGNSGGTGPFSLAITGGDIIIQNPPQTGGTYSNSRFGQMEGTATVHFGNAFTAGTGTFTAAGSLPNVIIDTAAGNHTLRMSTGSSSVGSFFQNMNIGPGGILNLTGPEHTHMRGDTFINNGIFRPSTTSLVFFDIDGGIDKDVTYSGSGTMENYFWLLQINTRTFTIGPAVGNISTRNLTIDSTDVINAGKIALLEVGNQTINVALLGDMTLDAAPVMDFDTSSWLSLTYNSTRTTGPEIPASRSIARLEYDSGVLTLAGGDLTVTNGANIQSGIIVTGPNKISVYGGPGVTTGYIDGTLRLKITNSAGTYNFPLGHNNIRSRMTYVNMTSVSDPSFLTATAFDGPLPGLLPATSVSRYWRVEEEGAITGVLSFTYPDVDAHGNEANYKLWQSTGGSPVMIGSTANPGTNTVGSAGNLSDFTGDWGIGEQLDPGPVSISGLVTTSAGNPIRNATVTISGGGLPAPVTVFTGSLGAYVINGLQAGNTYTVQASAKRYRFPPGGQQITPFGNVANVDFAANPQEEF